MGFIEFCRKVGGEYGDVELDDAAAAAAAAVAAAAMAAALLISCDCSLRSDENEDDDDEVDRCKEDLRKFPFRCL